MRSECVAVSTLFSLLFLHAAFLAAESAGVVPPPASVERSPPPPAATQPDPDAPLYATSTRMDRIGRVVAPVHINGKGPFRLVVDTGASHTTFSPRLVQLLGLVPSFDKTILLNGVTGSAQVPTVQIERIQAGDMVLEDVQVPVIWSSIMSNADGILGVAGLRNERIFVDFRRDRIEITRSRAAFSKIGYLKVPARRVAGGVLAVDTVIGGVRARAVIDTGAERTLGNTALRHALRSRRRSAKWQDTDVYGATETILSGQSSIAPPIKLGAATITGTEITYGDFHIFRLWNLDKRPAALIGMDVLGTVGALIIDFRERDIYFDVTSSPPTERTARSK